MLRSILVMCALLAACGAPGPTAPMRSPSQNAAADLAFAAATAIAEAMAPILTSGKLAWAPIASGRSGELGFTVGKATFTAARPEDSWRSTYATIWHRQPDGSWKVLFDTGRIVQAP